MPLRILGAGPAGSTAAIAALREGASVELIERSRFPRHKVCGEFLSPEIAPALERLGVLDRFVQARSFRVRRMALHLGRGEKRAPLPEVAYGLSRYTFDNLLYEHAISTGAAAAVSGTDAHIVAVGRHLPGQPHGGEYFGFKAHFEGPVDDAVELFFFGDCYVGINCIEEGRTNVCGLAPKSLLQSFNFHPEPLIERCTALRRRLEPLRPVMDWMFAGPLQFMQRWERRDVYLAGDSLSFVDPFTGSGMLCAVVTGSLAGVFAARGQSVDSYLQACRAAIHRPFAFSAMLRSLANTRAAEQLIRFVPGKLLFCLTRPR